MSRNLKDKRIEIFRNMPTKDNLGQSIDNYVSMGKCWAYTRQLSMNEYARYGLNMHDEERLFILNYNQWIKSNDRIRYRDTEYIITRIDTYDDNKNDLNVYVRKDIATRIEA